MLPRSIRSFILVCIVAVLSTGVSRAQTVVTLQLPSISSISPGSVLLVTANVTSGGLPVKTGVVDFYDGARLVGSAQIIGIASPWGAVGSANLRKFFAPGTHNLKATFRGTISLPAASSAISIVSVTGPSTVDLGLQYSGTTDLANHGYWDFESDFTLADINLDGRPDLLAIQFDEGEVAYAPGNPSDPGTFLPPTTFLQNGHTEGELVIAEDFNGDGLLDVAVLVADEDQVFLYLATAPGVFAAPKILTSSGLYPRLVVADFNGDGLPDIATVATGGNTAETLDIWFNNPATPGTFLPIKSFTFSNTSSSNWLQTADIDGDGLPDIVVNPEAFNSSALTVLRNNHVSPGLQWTATNYDLGVATWKTALADLNGDGLPDLVAGTFASSVLVALNDPSHPGTLLPPRNFSVPPVMQNAFVAGVAIGDVDGDGILDVAAADQNNHFVIFHGNGDGTLTPGAPITVSPPAILLSQLFAWQNSAIAIADLDGDGLGDVVLTEFRENLAQVYRHAPSPGALIQTDTFLSIPSSVYTNGQPIPLTVTEISTSGTVSGTVEFFDDAGSATISSIGTAPLVAGSAMFTIQNASIGFHGFFAIFHGDTTFAASESPGTGVVVIAGPTAAIALSSSPNPAAIAQLVTFRATISVATGTGTPGGTVSFFDGSVLLGTAPILSKVATLGTSTLTSGSHSITAVYSGDATFPPATSKPLVEIIQGPAVTTLSVNPASAPVTTSVRFSATVSSSAVGLPVPSGTVDFQAGSTSVGSAFLDSSGLATLTNSTLPVGTYAVTATYNGDTNYPRNLSNTAALSITPLPTSTTLSVSPNPGTAQSIETLQVQVQPALTGSVQILDGGSLIASVTLNANGHATLQTTFAVGAHSLTTVYPGSIQSLASTSAPVVLQILADDFALSLNPPTLTIQTQHHAPLGITLKSIGGFTGDISLACTNLPAWASGTFAQPTIHLNGGAPTTTTVMIDTDQILNFAADRHSAIPFVCMLPFGLLLECLRRSGRRNPTLWLTVFISIFIGSVTGCTGAYPLHTAPGTYTIQINAHSSTPALDHTQNVTLVVTQ